MTNVTQFPMHLSCEICGRTFTLGVDGIMAPTIWPSVKVCDECGGVVRANGTSGPVISYDVNKILQGYKALSNKKEATGKIT